MEYNLSKGQWDEVKIKFNAWMEATQRKKELQDECREICKDCASIIDGKSADASKLFKAMAQKWEGEESDAEKIAMMLEQLAANGGN